MPSRSCLVCIGWANHVEVGDSSQRGQMFDGLVSGPIFTQADRIVCPHIGHGQSHESCESNSRAHVVTEDQERAAKYFATTVKGDSVHDRAHRVLANTERDVGPARRSRHGMVRTLDVGVVGLAEVC